MQWKAFFQLCGLRPHVGAEHEGGPLGRGGHHWCWPWHPQEDAGVHLHWAGGQLHYKDVIPLQSCCTYVPLEAFQEYFFTKGWRRQLHCGASLCCRQIWTWQTGEHFIIFVPNKSELNIEHWTFNMNTQVKLCAAHFRADVTPDTAAEILLLADRHCLGQLKQVHCYVTFRKCGFF